MGSGSKSAMNTLSEAAESQTEYRRVFDTAVAAVFQQALQIMRSLIHLFIRIR